MFVLMLILTPLRLPLIGVILFRMLYEKHGVGVASVDSTKASYHGFVPPPLPASFLRLISTQAWIEASTKGAILILTSTEVEYYAQKHLHASNAVAGVFGGVAGGAAQAYLTMGRIQAYRIHIFR